MALAAVLSAAAAAAAAVEQADGAGGSAVSSSSSSSSGSAPAQLHPLSHLSLFFARCTSDLALFESVVSAFPAAKGRVNEVFATCGMPLCYESPAPGDAATAPYGLPKTLGTALVASNGGVVQDSLLLAMLCTGLLDEAGLARLLHLASRHQFTGAAPFRSCTLLAAPGVAEVLAARRGASTQASAAPCAEGAQ